MHSILRGTLSVFAFFALVFFSTAYAAEPVFARYVRIDLPGHARILSLAEVQVYSGKRLISESGGAKQVSTMGNAIAAKAIDGNTSGAFFGGSVTHTQLGEFVWWELDLGSDQEITKLVIYNRTDCCSERINPARITLRTAEQKVVWQQSLQTTETRYEFDIGSSAPGQIMAGRNLLANATFLQRTNPPLPDYWDLHHAAALTFKDLYRHYGLDDSVIGPVSGASVLKITNSEDNFPYVILMPKKIDINLPGGDYTFSVYIKADRNTIVSFSKSWAVSQKETITVNTQWQRYTFTFQNKSGARDLQPILYFPKKATYYVTAPQLEEGSTVSPFEARKGNGSLQTAHSSGAQSMKAWTHTVMEHSSKNIKEIKTIQLATEYDYYTNQDKARLRLSSTNPTDVTVPVTCFENVAAGAFFYKKTVTVAPKNTTFVEVPIRNLPSGVHSCTISTFERNGSSNSMTVEIKKLIPSPIEVRVNANKRFVVINNTPFSIIGMAIRPGVVPDWYFRDIKLHGINTIFYNGIVDKNHQYDIENLKSVISTAAKYDLKVIVGLAIAGAKPTDWRRRLSSFISVVHQLKEYPQIIGWYPLDEPAANSWLDREVLDVYEILKNEDPYRLVFINWAYDGVPKEVGAQPRGTLNATDVYAIDYYPFTAPSHSLVGFTEITARAGMTASLNNKPFFSWLQLFGGNDAWREPTAAELNYMAFATIIYGGMIGYFDTKSNSAATWERLRAINLQSAELSQKLFLHEGAVPLVPAVATDQFLYVAWKREANVFLVVANRDSSSREFSYDVSSLTRQVSKLSVRSMFEKRNVKLQNGHIDEWFAPYESRVYEVQQ